MNGYKKLISDRKSRIAILRALDFLPDSFMIKLQYRIKLGRKLNLKNPQRYTEKLQWYKLNYRDPLMKLCTDKYAVREYVSQCGYGDILNECYGVYNSPEEIDFDSLPQSFVLKDTLGGGGNSVILVRDKNSLNVEETRQILQGWVNEPTNKKSPGREPSYDGMKHRIIVEKLLFAGDDGDLPDYKFFCFSGKVFCSYMMENYTMHHDEGIMGFLNRDFELLPVRRADFTQMKKQPLKPKNYERMVEIAEALSRKFPHVRVDLYNIDGVIVFGELTFYNASGYVQFDPDEFDFEAGEKFILPDAKPSKGETKF